MMGPARALFGGGGPPVNPPPKLMVPLGFKGCPGPCRAVSLGSMGAVGAGASGAAWVGWCPLASGPVAELSDKGCAGGVMEAATPGVCSARLGNNWLSGLACGAC